MNADQSLHILLVEDNLPDIVLTKKAIERSTLQCNLQYVRDGEQALKILEMGKNDHGFPDLILLDINMPKVSGHEVLGHIKNDPELKQIPVIMLTSSESDIDKKNALRYDLTSYVVKPATVSELVNFFNNLHISISFL